MTKIIPLSDIQVRYLNDEWICLDEGFPPPDVKMLFYNEFLDEFKVCTLNEIEENFKFFRQNFNEYIQDKDYVSYYVQHTFKPTHWKRAPVRPELTKKG